jgi:hypothetical protein
MMVALLSKRFEIFGGTGTHERKRGGHHVVVQGGAAKL